MPPSDIEVHQRKEMIPKLSVGQLLFLLSLCLLCGAVGYLIGLPDNNVANEEIRLGNNSQYQYINPLLDYQSPPEILLMSDINRLKNELENEIEDNIKNGQIIDASIYYRDLNNGPWFAINDDLTYAPASLLKIPLMIAYYKMAETDKSVLSKKVSYTTPYQYVPEYSIDNATSTILVGQSYTIDELINLMITQSDNIATLLLQDNIDIDAAEKVFSDFAVSLPDFLTPEEDYIHAREYASFFRVLYNSTYLNREYSEKALALLEQSTFNKGLRANIDNTINVSHKFGVSIDKTGEKQLHDCGIVYLPNKPYMVCIMTTGDDYQKMSKVIAKLSSIIYENVKKSEE